jgi:hypothetical protein
MSDQGSPIDATSSVPGPEIDTDDMADDLRKAVTELRGEPSTPEAKVILDRPRDEVGRFAEGKVAEKTTLTLPVKDAAAKPAEGVVADPAAAIGTPAVPAVKAPEGLKPELKAKFGELSPEWQQEWARREADTHKIATRADDERLFGKKMRDTITPYLSMIQQEGGTPEQAAAELFRTAAVLRSPNPQIRAQALRAIAQQFNVDLGTPLQSGPQSPEIAHLEQRLAAAEARLQDQTQQRQAQDEAGLQAQIADFSSKPGHEHFEAVKPMMGALMMNGLAPGLEEAYQMAIYANPDIRSTLLAAQKPVENGKQVAAERARSAAVSVTGSPAGGMKSLNGSGSVGSVEDDVRAAVASHSGRV